MNRVQNKSLFASPLQKLEQVQSNLSAIGPDTKLADVLMVIAKAANDVLAGHFCVVFPYDQSNDAFLMKQITSAGIPKVRDFPWAKPRSEGTVRTALREGVFVAEDYEKDVERYPFLTSAGAFQDVAEVNACIGICLQAGKEKVGVLFVNYLDPHPFTEDDKLNARLFASQAAIAIRNVRLHETERRILARLEGLVEATQSISALRRDTEPREILEKIVQTANEVLGADVSVIFPYDEQTDSFIMEQLAAATGEETETYQWQTPRDEGGTRKILEQDELIAMNLEEAPSEWKMLVTGPFKEHFRIQAMAGLALRVGTEKVGVLYVNYRTRHSFDEHERNLIKDYANTAAVILYNARLYEQSSQRADTLTRLGEVGQALVSPEALAGELEHLLQQVAENAQEVLGADVIAVYQYIQDRGEFALPPVRVGNLRIHSVPTEVFDDDVVLKIVRRKSPLYASDAQNEPPLSGPFEVDRPERLGGGERFVVREGIVSSAAVPLRAGDESVGVMFVNYREPQLFTEDQRRVIELFANNAAVAIHNTRLFDESQGYITSIEKLLGIAGDLTSAMTDPERVLQTTIEQTVDLFAVTRGAIVLYENGYGRLVAAFDTRSDVTSVATSVRFPDSPLQRTIRDEGRLIILENIKTDPLLSSIERERFLERGIKTSMILPLIARGDVLGSIGLDESRRQRSFSDREQELAQILAGLAAVAIDNARMYGLTEQQLSDVIKVSQNLMGEAARPEIELKDFLQYVMEQTLNLLDFNAGWLLLREGDWTRIVATDKDHADDVNRAFLIQDSISGQSMLTKDAINIPDLTDMPEAYKGVYKAPRGGVMKSELVVPLLVGDNAIGAFNIESDREKAFTSRHEEMLKLLSNDVALAIELARARDQTAALSRIGLELARATEMGDVVRLVLESAFDLVGGEFGQVLLREGETLVVHYTTNDPPTDMDLVVNIDDCITGLAVQERRAVIVPDVEKPDYLVVDFTQDTVGREGKLIQRTTGTPRYERALERDKTEIQAQFVVPLWSDDTLIGMLNIETQNESGFTQQQRDAVLSFSQSDANRFVSALSLPRDRTTLMRLLRGALAHAGTNFGQILRLDGEWLVIEQTTGSEQIGTRVLVSKSVSGRVVSSKAPVYVPDVTQDPDYQRYLGEEMKSELAIPLLVGEEVIGVLNLESPVPGFFTLDHARTLEAFAGYAAVAMERAKTFEGQRLAEVGGVAGDIVHSLNNPLGAIGMGLNLLTGKSFYPELLLSYPYLVTFITRTERELGNAKEIVQRLREERMKGKQDQPMVLQSVVHSALKKANLPKDIQVELSSLDETVQVVANERLENVFWNLCDNARKAMPNGGKLTITAILPVEGQHVHVEVRDTGRGIEPWRLNLIFEMEESTTDDSNAPGHGLGLWWTKAQVESFGGSIQAESKIGVGTCVTLTLRKAE